MERLWNLIGRETDIDEVARTLYGVVDAFRAPAVGAIQITCSDESERECIDAFQTSFAEHLLPSLKFGERAVFRLANLGARYERGAVQIADQHYAGAIGADRLLLLVVKINSHVAAETTPDGRRFGTMQRYKAESPYCGALDALIRGVDLPFVEDLRLAFAEGGTDRLAALLERHREDPSHTAVIAAVLNARLQAERAVADILDSRPETPTRFLVVSSVTLNRRGKDTEVVCGVHDVDWQGADPMVDHRGLGTDPSTLRVTVDLGRVTIED